MAEKSRIDLREASKGVTVHCQQCQGVVRGKGDIRCACDTPQLSNSATTLDAMLMASRRGNR